MVLGGTGGFGNSASWRQRFIVAPTTYGTRLQLKLSSSARFGLKTYSINYVPIPPLLTSV